MLRTASAFMLSHNKHAYAVEALSSLLAQDHDELEIWVLENSTDGVTRDMLRTLCEGDERVWLEEIDLTWQDRDRYYVPAWLLNQYYPKAAGEFIFYLSDDDLLDPDCVSRCVDFLNAEPGRDVCYFSHRHHRVWGPGQAEERYGEIEAGTPLGDGTDNPMVDSRIDGGQIVHRKSCLDALDEPWFPEDPSPGSASHADGLFMQKLAWEFTFHPLPEYLGTARRTPLSLWSQP